MIIRQIFTEPETEVKWYFDNISRNNHRRPVLTETGSDAILPGPASRDVDPP